jgi:citrate:succinate antiporter/L-tartrate/succinate antiporter
MEANSNYTYYVKLLAPVVIGLLVFMCPIPEGLSANAWLYTSIFAGLVVGLILEPIPPALIGIIAVVLAVLFKVGPVGSGKDGAVIKSAAAVDWGLSGFSNSVVWLIFAAFMIGIGYHNSGLGKRIAFLLVNKLGTSTLGLGYAIALADLVLAPFIPSNAARSGGTIYPIVTSIPPMFESYPEKDARKIGAYLVWVSLATTCVSSSIFLTGQAPNPLALELASKAGAHSVSWMGWFLAFAPVGLVLFAITPILALWIYPPEIKGSPIISKWAGEELAKLGKISRGELFMLSISVLALVLWIGSDFFGINATTTALIVIVLMIAAKIIAWNDFLGNKPAWNVLTWFATLVTMAAGLKNVGFLEWIAKATGSYLHGLTPFMAVLGLIVAFSVLRYFFASGTAYVTAMVGLFTVLAISIPNTDPSQTMLMLLLPMGIMGVLTPYGTGHSPVWFASGYVTGPEFWRLGAIFGAIYLGVFLLIGLPWIKFIYPYIAG